MAAFGDPAALLAGLDAAMSLAQSHQRARQVGQTSLFDLFGSDASAESGGPAAPGAPAFALPAVPPVERRQRLAWEKEMIGLYISEHPLRAVARALAAKNTCPIVEITEEMAGQTVTLGGFIASLRLIPTKKGDLMAAVELEDLGGSAEVIVFPRTYQAQRDILKEDTIVLVTGKIEARDDRPKILCETVDVFEADPDELAPEDGETTEAAGAVAPTEAQTAYPLDAGEAAAAEFEGPAPEGSEAVASGGILASSAEGPSPAWPVTERTVSVGVEQGAEVAPDVTVVSVSGFTEVTEGADVRAVEEVAETSEAARHFVLEVRLERSAREDRDVNRLVRLNELLGRFPGRDRVVLRFILNGRDGPALDLPERVECCEPLLDELGNELGENGLRVRVAGAYPQEVGDEAVVAMAGAIRRGVAGGAPAA
jgi:DNA polymerase-3 subunit alpha